MSPLEKVKTDLLNYNDKLAALIEDVKKPLIEEIRKNFPSYFKELFEENPNVENFGWSQYTPYFNDGDTCEFTVHTDYICINDFDEYSSKINPNIFHKFIAVLKVIPDDFYLDLFGDHNEIMIYSSGEIKIIKYSHD